MTCTARLILGAVTLLYLVGCARSPQPAGAPRGTVKISGAWALYPLVVAWAEEFQRLHPHVRIDVSAGGAGKGMADALAGLVDLGMVSRDIAPEEITRGANPIPVAKDAVVCIVNARCPAAAALATQGFTRARLQPIWLSTNTFSWQQFGAPHHAFLSVYTRSDAAGAPETWARYLGAVQEQLHGTGVYGDPGIVEAVRKDVNGIGYCNLNFAYEAHSGTPVDGIQVVPLDTNENGRVDPEERLDTRAAAQQAVAAGVYPAPPARPLYLVAKGPITKPVVAAFLRWALTDGQTMVESNGYILLPIHIFTNALHAIAQ